MLNRSVNQFEVRKKLQDAYASGRYFVTVTTLDEKTRTLNHFWAWDNFPAGDVLPSLEHIANEIDAKSHPETDTESR